MDTTGSRATRGAISELRACAHLMDDGYYVYRCESPHAPFDLVAYKDGQCLRVEVKSITHKTPDSETYAPAFCWPRNSEWDLLVVVDDDRNQVFCFDSATSKHDARNAVRQHYGFPSMDIPGRICPHCSGAISERLQTTAIYCSIACRHSAYLQRQKPLSGPQDEPSAVPAGPSAVQPAVTHVIPSADPTQTQVTT